MPRNPLTRARRRCGTASPSASPARPGTTTAAQAYDGGLQFLPSVWDAYGGDEFADKAWQAIQGAADRRRRTGPRRCRLDRLADLLPATGAAMTATAWLFLAVVAGIVAAGVVLERWQRRIDEAERRRYEDRSQQRLMRELGRIEPVEPRRRP